MNKDTNLSAADGQRSINLRAQSLNNTSMLACM